jgi:regulatory protein
MRRRRAVPAPVDAFDEASRLLARRALTRDELTRRLARRGHGPEEIEAALRRLEQARLLDDRALARDWMTSRAAAGRGRLRAIAELTARGIPPDDARRAWSEAEAAGEIDATGALDRAVRRRLGASPGTADRARLARVYNALLSEGFEPDAVASALEPYGLEGIPE